MSKRLGVTFVLAMVLLVSAGAAGAGAQERRTGSSGAIEKALAEYLTETRVEAEDQLPLLKGVPRTDKAEASVVGTVALIDGTDFLSDGTPFRVIVVRSRKPITQEVFIVCVGSAFNSSCGRLGLGRRVSITSDILVIEEGDSAGLALFIAKRLQT